MKPTAFCCCLLVLASTGCFTFTRGMQETGLPTPRAVMVAEPPPPVKAEGITESNAQKSLKQLEDEVRFDEEAVADQGAPALAEVP